jgi:predicted dehydrogenase
MAIRGESGLLLGNGDRLVPEPFLLGRDAAKLALLAAANGGLKWSTDRDASLADPEIKIYFDASATGGRVARATAALEAGKHVYLEKPIAETLIDALNLARRAERTGLKNGVVQDKLFLPGLVKLRKLYETDFFGRVLSIRLDFGWWVFDGTRRTGQDRRRFPDCGRSWPGCRASATIWRARGHWRNGRDRCRARNSATRPRLRSRP